MKKIVSFLLVGIMLVLYVSLFSACNTKETIICSSCGKENQADVKFCSNCGEVLNSNEKTNNNLNSNCSHEWEWHSGTVTCSNNGYIIYKCNFCDETKKEYEVAYGCYDIDEDDYCDDCYSYLGESNYIPDDNTSHTHSSSYYVRVGNRWEHLCGCGETYYENIDFFNEIVEFVKTNGEYSNYTYECMVGSDISNGYTYNRYVSYDAINQELCFVLTFGQYMRLEIYMMEISREYNYYFEDRESNCFIRGIIDTNQCVSSYYCFTDDDNIENTNVTGALLYEFAETVQSQVKLFIACFNNDFAETYVTAQDFCFPALN